LRGDAGPLINVESYLCANASDVELYGGRGAFSAKSSHLQITYSACESNTTVCVSKDEEADYLSNHLLTLYATNTFLSSDKNLPSFGNSPNDDKSKLMVKQMLQYDMS